MAVQQPRYRFTVDDFHRMEEAGILAEDDRVELIEGEISQTSPIGSGHAESVTVLSDVLVPLMREAAIVRVRNPIHVSDLSEPQPDIAVVRRKSYRSQHPTPDAVLLLTEVADTPITYDRQAKLPIYAQDGIPEIWLVDLYDESITRFLNPRSGTYERIDEFRGAELITSGILPEISIRVEVVFLLIRDANREIAVRGDQPAADPRKGWRSCPATTSAS